MPKAKMSRVEQFLKRVARAPLFEHVGEPVDGDVVTVRSWDAAMKTFEKRTWDEVLLRAENFAHAQAAVEYGEKWYDENDESRSIEALVKATVYKRIDAAWRRHKLPKELGRNGWLKPIRRVRGWFFQIAYDYAYESAVTKSFPRDYLEPWILAGHFPCGWKGRLPADVMRRSGVGFTITKKRAAASMAETFGDGKLIVY